jgi:NADPH:quinone reductase-like Zn-dependent oxidoreductase
MVFLVKASTWPSYKESLVRRGQVLLDFDVLDGWDNELSHMNHGKVGEPLHDYGAVFDTVGGDTYKRSFKISKKGGGIIVSMLEQPNSELMNQYGIKALFQFTQANRNN